jgi:hypothetical protein
LNVWFLREGRKQDHEERGSEERGSEERGSEEREVRKEGDHEKERVEGITLSNLSS